jgi:Tfp pilus assembly protein PilF
MLFRTLALTAAVVVFAPSAYAASSSTLPDAARHSDDDARSEAKAQVEFGIKAAQNELWKEATYRWEKATELDPTYAEAWNNLAIGYEYQGRFEDAEAAYQRALKLDPKSILIRQNYDLFNEINNRTKRRRDR